MVNSVTSITVILRMNVSVTRNVEHLLLTGNLYLWSLREQSYAGGALENLNIL